MTDFVVTKDMDIKAEILKRGTVIQALKGASQKADEVGSYSDDYYYTNGRKDRSNEEEINALYDEVRILQDGYISEEEYAAADAWVAKARPSYPWQPYEGADRRRKALELRG